MRRRRRKRSRRCIAIGLPRIHVQTDVVVGMYITVSIQAKG
jgi:hypothetical protein